MLPNSLRSMTVIHVLIFYYTCTCLVYLYTYLLLIFHFRFISEFVELFKSFSVCSRKELKDIFDTYALPYNTYKDASRDKQPEIYYHGNRSVSQVEETSFIGIGGKGFLYTVLIIPKFYSYGI